MAFPLAEGITDPPVIALTCLALALLIRFGGAGWRPAVVLGAVCAMKYTAWPALAVLIVMVMVRYGGRAAARFTGTALGTAIGLTIALAPAGILHPAAIVANTVAYPLGLTAARSPAASPLPGHLLATLGPAGRAAAIALLLAAGAALVASLVKAPPSTSASAAKRIALGLTALFALSPATRFGYFCYPLALYGWVALAGYAARAAAPDASPPSDTPSAGPLEAERPKVTGRGRPWLAQGSRDGDVEGGGDLGLLTPDLGTERNVGRGALGPGAPAALARYQDLGGAVGWEQGLDRALGRLGLRNAGHHAEPVRVRLARLEGEVGAVALPGRREDQALSAPASSIRATHS